MKTDFLEKAREKIIRSFMDILALKVLQREPNISGYDLIKFIHKRFGVLVSSGTAYSALYSLERSGLIRGIMASRKRIYKLTAKGKEALQAIENAKKELQRLTTRIL